MADLTQFPLIIGLIFILIGFMALIFEVKRINIPNIIDFGDLQHPISKKQCGFLISAGIILSLISLILSGYLSLPSPKVVLLDSMDSVDGWDSDSDNGSVINIESVEGIKGNAIKIDYNLASGKWVKISKIIDLDKINKDINEINKISFMYKASGYRNSIEIELDDSNGTYFGYKWRKSTGAANWTPKEVQIKDLKCWGTEMGLTWGDCQDYNLDLNKLKTLEFAISSNDDEDGRSGEVTIDEVKGSEV